VSAVSVHLGETCPGESCSRKDMLSLVWRERERCHSPAVGHDCRILDFDVGVQEHSSHVKHTLAMDAVAMTTILF
jgi:hypothetical protein